MKLAIMQPYMFPYIGYWQLINAVDKFVVYDDVNYIKGGWINRNNILISGKKQLFTIRLNGSSSFKLIKEVGVLDDFNKFTKTLQLNYGKTPQFSLVMDVINEIIRFDKTDAGKFIYNSIDLICKYLGVDTQLMLSSDIEKDYSLKAQDKVIDICKRLGASEYYNAIGGTELYNADTFGANGIELRFIKTEFIPYKQFKNEFISGLSILDVMMFNDVETIRQMLEEYTLV